MKKLILLVFLCITIPAIAQKQGNIWYFGNYAGINFNTSPPTALTDGKLATSEGCSSISDANGNLLFYTDGITVYNKQHLVMENGNGLYGDPSSSQSGVIVPHPGNPNLYFVFTVQLQGGALCYSMVDIAKQGGLGEVIEKNTQLLAGSTEKITAVRHNSSQAIWVIAHEYPSQNFVSYLITANGLQAVPVISKVGTFMGQSPLSTIGYLKASPKGDKLAAAMDHVERIVETYDFDAGTGKISNPVTLTGFGGSGPYGVEFSPNGKLLYISEEGFFDTKIYQIKLPVKADDVKNVSYVVSNTGNAFALQLASDGKIYIARGGGGSLAAIEEPNLEGALCKYNPSAIDLKGAYSTLGLPTFIQSFFAEVSFTSAGNCIGDITQFTAKSSLEGIDSLRWNFGDARSLPRNNTSVLENPSHKYTDTGSYIVTVKAYSKGVMTPFEKTIVISPIPSVNLGKDTTLFYGQTLLLDAKWPGSSFKWSTGSTDQTLLVTAPGTYSVDVTSSAGCGGSGSIKIGYDQVIDVTLPADTTICAFETIKLDATLPGGGYLWSNGSTASSIMINQEGQYSVKITNAYHNREKTLNINVHFFKFSPITVTSDTILCEAGSTSISVAGAKNGEKYHWFDAQQNFVEENSGTFYTGIIKRDTVLFVQLTNGKCLSDLQPVHLIFDKPTATIFNKDTVITLGANVNLQGSGAKYYRWLPDTYLDNANIANPVSSPGDDVTYQLIVVNENGCSDTATVTIRVKKKVLIPNTFTPNGDGVNDTWAIKYLDRLPGNHMFIYTRSGRLVRQFKGYYNSWDGTSSKGEPLPSGVYYYVLEIDETNRQSGYVTLIR